MTTRCCFRISQREPCGIVSVCSHLVGPQLKQIFAAWNDGKIEEARRIYLELLPLMTVIMGVTASPIPVKAAVRMLGLHVGEPRLPVGSAHRHGGGGHPRCA